MTRLFLLAVTSALAGARALASAEFLPAPCPEGVDPDAVRCGTLSVPVDYEAPTGKRIDLYAVVVPAVEQRPGMVPLVPLAGGPGNSIADLAAWHLDPQSAGYALRRDRPVVLLDQRGTGRSNPLHCPALEARGPLDRFYPPDDVRQCRDALARNDLRHFRTLEAAEDLERLRSALHYDRIDLSAISYGTVLAQVYLRAHPERVRSAVLIGTAPLDARFPLFHALNAQRVLDLLFFECQSDRRCREAYPDLRGEWRRLLARLERDAPTVTLDGADGEPRTATVQGDAFGEAFRNLLASTAGMRRVPWIVHEAAGGNWSPLLDALPGGGDAFFATGLYLSATCTESTARIRDAEIGPAVAATFLGDHRVREQRTACEQWPRLNLSDMFFEPVRSDVPVLLLSGELDYVTPPAWSYEVARGLSRARVVTMPHGGHVYWDWGEGNDGETCFDALMLEFYTRGDARLLDIECTRRATPPPFFVPGTTGKSHASYNRAPIEYTRGRRPATTTSRRETAMAVGWARDGAVQEQIDANVDDAVKRARSAMPRGESLLHCEECGVDIPAARRQAVPGVRRCVDCQSAIDEEKGAHSGYNRRGSKDSQLR